MERSRGIPQERNDENLHHIRNKDEETRDPIEDRKDASLDPITDRSDGPVPVVARNLVPGRCLGKPDMRSDTIPAGIDLANYEGLGLTVFYALAL